MFSEDGSFAFQTNSVEMIILVAILFVVALGLLYRYKWRYEIVGGGTNGKGAGVDWVNVVLVFGVAFLVKLILAGVYEGHGTDMNCFSVWSDMIFNDGPWAFYHSDSFTDYPPGYMTLLWLVGGIRYLFNLDTATAIGRIVIKFIPLAFDMGAGFLLYKMARRKFSDTSSLLLAICYVLNPLIVVDSSAWGQVDSVFTFFIFLVCYLCMEERRIPAYFVFAAGILIKPQILMFAPILIWTIIEQVFLDDFNTRKMCRDLIFGLLAIAAMVIFTLPFGTDVVFSQYVNTLASYPYGTINAYNFWAIMGMNWQTQTHQFLGLPASTWGTLIILISVAVSGLVFFKLKEDKSRYFLSMAVLIGTMFLFSVRMHERYLFPIAILLLAGFVIRPKKEILFSYAVFSALNFINVADVLYEYIENSENTYMQGGIVGITALLTLLAYAYMYFAIFTKSQTDIIKKRVKTPKKWEEYKLTIRPTKKPGRFTKWDWTALIGILVVYSLFAFYDLGDRQAPETNWQATENAKTITLDMGQEQDIGMVYAYLGAKEDRTFSIQVSKDGKNYEEKGTVRATSVFCWDALKIWEESTQEEGGDSYNWEDRYRYIRLTASNDLTTEISMLNELVVTDTDGNVLMPVNSSEYETLFDEQQYFEPQEDAPETVWRAEKAGTQVVLDLGAERYISQIHLYSKTKANQKFTFEMAKEDEVYTPMGTFASGEADGWSKFDKLPEITDTYRYIRLTTEMDNVEANEIVLTDSENHIIEIREQQGADELTDEQDGYNKAITFRSGTYFDEIYHARTAYEIVHGMSHYEWTHPPLGKVFISLGVRAFGMNPFGWRIIGALFGIGMLPFMYMFGRRLFQGKTWAAAALTFLFAFDFMHFTQTRIATIDVYGTFFIIAMFFFMYCYSQTSFYDTKLWKTFIPLSLSAVMMGLGCASKWTAVYAAAGLGVFFFAIMGWRIYEYHLAKKEPNGETAGILHSHIIEVFSRNLIATLLFCVLFFVIVAGTIYLCSYIPFADSSIDNAQRFMGTDWDETPFAGLVSWLRDNSGNSFAELFGKMLNNQKAMYTYHHDLNATHPFSSTWNEWPLMIRPVYYYCQTLTNGLKEGISAFGNPLVWWAGIPALLFVVCPFGKRISKRFGTPDVQWLQWSGCIFTVFLGLWSMFMKPAEAATMSFGDLFAEWGWYGYPLVVLGVAGFVFLCAQMFSRGDNVAVFILFAYAVQYIPWVLVPRCTFAYHYFPSVPFVVMLIVYSMDKLITHNRKWLKWCVAYLAVAFLLFLIFYPVLSGQSILEGYARDGLRWLEDWQLIS